MAAACSGGDDSRTTPAEPRGAARPAAPAAARAAAAAAEAAGRQAAAAAGPAAARQGARRAAARAQAGAAARPGAPAPGGSAPGGTGGTGARRPRWRYRRRRRRRIGWRGPRGQRRRSAGDGPGRSGRALVRARRRRQRIAAPLRVVGHRLRRALHRDRARREPEQHRRVHLQARRRRHAPPHVHHDDRHGELQPGDRARGRRAHRGALSPDRRRPGQFAADVADGDRRRVDGRRPRGRASSSRSSAIRSASATARWARSNDSDCFPTESHWDAFPSFAARALGAEVSTIGASGRGIYRNYGGDMTDTMPKVYDRILTGSATPAWPFQIQPQVVVINLGTNDISNGKGDPGTPFRDAYTGLLQNVRARIPTRTSSAPTARCSAAPSCRRSRATSAPSFRRATRRATRACRTSRASSRRPATRPPASTTPTPPSRRLWEICWPPRSAPSSAGDRLVDFAA